MTDASLPTGFFRPIEFAGKPLGGGAVPAICIPLVAREAVALQSELHAVLALAPDIIEWRVDHFLTANKVELVPDVLQQLRAALMVSMPAARPPLIFTLRSQAEGGEA
ncbi:MAG: type I 3-dehydroquinate dehydratase, partial [Gammaproteobacteria bacterium]